MKLRNKSRTAYRDAKKKLAILPGQTVEISMHDGHELLKTAPWLFEEIKEEKREAASDKGSDSGAPAEQTASTSKHRRGH